MCPSLSKLKLLIINKVSMVSYSSVWFSYTTTVKPPNKGHLGTRAGVPYSEVVLYSEVLGKIVLLHSIHVYNIIRVLS